MTNSFSFLTRVNQAISRYMKVIYDERRDQVIVMMRVPARAARNTLTKESLADSSYICFISKRYCNMNLPYLISSSKRLAMKQQKQISEYW